jgi:peptide/nickel transport system permease protein
VKRLLRNAANSLLLLLGVTFVSFLLMVYFAPDQTYAQLGKNASAEQIREVRRQLGYDQPFVRRYVGYLTDLATLQLGSSQSSGEPVTTLLWRTVPVSVALVLPGFIFGNLLGILLALVCVRHLGRWPDRLINVLSIGGMSLSFLIVIIAAQVLLSTPYGLNLFPVRGWQVNSLPSYVYYAAVPTLCMVIITLGYNTRFYRAVFAEEFARPHVLTLRALGAQPYEILARHVLKNSAVAVLTRIMFTVPLVVISGSLLIESYFGIPGVGKATFDAIASGDQPVLKAIVALTAVLFIVARFAADRLCALADPRISTSVAGSPTLLSGSEASR